MWGAARIRDQVHDLQSQLAWALTDPVTVLAVRRVSEDAIVAAAADAVLTVALADLGGLHPSTAGRLLRHRQSAPRIRMMTSWFPARFSTASLPFQGVRAGCRWAVLADEPPSRARRGNS
jgi:hypothetical protein